MNISNLAALVEEAILCSIRDIRSEFCDKSVYGFVIVTPEGFTSVLDSFGTREDLSATAYDVPILGSDLSPEILEEVKADPDLFALLVNVKIIPEYLIASGWSHFGHYDHYSKVNDFLDVEYFDNAHLAIEEVIVQSLLRLKDEGKFRGSPFEDDLLLCIQQTDDPLSEATIRSSEILNSEDWHEKLLKHT